MGKAETDTNPTENYKAHEDESEYIGEETSDLNTDQDYLGEEDIDNLSTIPTGEISDGKYAVSFTADNFLEDNGNVYLNFDYYSYKAFLKRYSVDNKLLQTAAKKESASKTNVLEKTYTDQK